MPEYSYTYDVPDGWLVIPEKTVVTPTSVSFTVECSISDCQTTITFDRDFSATGAGPVGVGSHWPLVSDAMKIHPQDVEAHMEHCKKAGIPTDFTAKGQPILRDRAHRKEYMQSFGLYDYQGGYGDSTP